MLHAVFTYEGRPAALVFERGIGHKSKEGRRVGGIKKKAKKTREFLRHELEVISVFSLAEGQRPSSNAT